MGGLVDPTPSSSSLSAHYLLLIRFSINIAASSIPHFTKPPHSIHSSFCPKRLRLSTLSCVLCFIQSCSLLFLKMEHFNNDDLEFLDNDIPDFEQDHDDDPHSPTTKSHSDSEDDFEMVCFLQKVLCFSILTLIHF